MGNITTVPVESVSVGDVITGLASDGMTATGSVIKKWDSLGVAVATGKFDFSVIENGTTVIIHK